MAGHVAHGTRSGIACNDCEASLRGRSAAEHYAFVKYHGQSRHEWKSMIMLPLYRAYIKCETRVAYDPRRAISVALTHDIQPWRGKITLIKVDVGCLDRGSIVAAGDVMT